MYVYALLHKKYYGIGAGGCLVHLSYYFLHLVRIKLKLFYFTNGVLTCNIITFSDQLTNAMES